MKQEAAQAGACKVGACARTPQCACPPSLAQGALQGSSTADYPAAQLRAAPLLRQHSSEPLLSGRTPPASLSGKACPRRHNERPSQRCRPVQACCCRKPSTQHPLRGCQLPPAVCRLCCHAALLAALPCNARCGQTRSSDQHSMHGQLSASSRAGSSVHREHAQKPKRSRPTGCEAHSKG